MKNENITPEEGAQEEKRKQLIEIAKEKLTELDDEQLEKLAGGAVAGDEAGSYLNCSCNKVSCN